MSDLKPNAELAYRALDEIDAHPELHNQKVWIKQTDCGTAGCLAGWVCLISGDRPEFGSSDETEDVTADGKEWYVPERAAGLLGIDFDNDTTWGNGLFDPSHTREDLGRLVAEIFGPRPAVSA